MLLQTSGDNNISQTTMISASLWSLLSDCAGTAPKMLSFFNSAFNKMLLKRKRATDEVPAVPEDADEAPTEHRSKRKHHHCAPPEPPLAANKAWCCRSHSSCQAGTSSSHGGEDLASDCHLARMGSVSLELRKPAALSDLAALPSDVLQTVFQQLPLPVNIQVLCYKPQRRALKLESHSAGPGVSAA